MLNSTHTILCFERTYRSHALSVHALPWCLYVQLNLMCMCDGNFIKFQMIDTIVVQWTQKCLLSINFIVEFTTFGSKLKKAYSTIYFYVLQTMHKIRMFAWLRLIVKNSYMKKKNVMLRRPSCLYQFYRDCRCHLNVERKKKIPEYKRKGNAMIKL